MSEFEFSRINKYMLGDLLYICVFIMNPTDTGRNLKRNVRLNLIMYMYNKFALFVIVPIHWLIMTTRVQL